MVRNKNNKHTNSHTGTGFRTLEKTVISINHDFMMKNSIKNPIYPHLKRLFSINFVSIIQNVR